MIDSNTMQCSMEPITMKSWDSVETADHHHIRMKTSDEFFGTNVKEYSCKGNTTVRGIPAQVMASTRNGTRSNPNEKVSLRVTVIPRSWGYCNHDNHPLLWTPFSFSFQVLLARKALQLRYIN